MPVSLLHFQIFFHFPISWNPIKSYKSLSNFLGNSYTNFIILDVKLCFTCGELNFAQKHRKLQKLYVTNCILCMIYLDIISLADVVSEWRTIYESYLFISFVFSLCSCIYSRTSNCYNSLHKYVCITVVTRKYYFGIFSGTLWSGIPSFFFKLYFQPDHLLLLQLFGLPSIKRFYKHRLPTFLWCQEALAHACCTNFCPWFSQRIKIHSL